MSPTSTSKGRSKGKLREIRIYSGENRQGPDVARLAKRVQGYFPPVKVIARKPLHHLVKKKSVDELALRLASARVKDPTSPLQAFEPMFGEVDYERRVLEGDARAGGIVYHGAKLEEIFSSILGPRTEFSTASIVLTDRLVSTFSRDDLRQHLRTVVFGFPSVISIPGIIEAPAKPREYYVLKQQLGEMSAARLKSAMKGRFIDYEDDKAIADVLEGLLLQCVLFHLTLEPFCRNKGCRMFNAHWQEDLIHSQVTSKKFCKKHAELLCKLGEEPIIEW